MSLGKLRHSKGEPARPSGSSPGLQEFTQGFETPDLRDARRPAGRLVEG